MRKEFEEWFNEVGKLAVLADTSKDGAGNYYFAETRLLWGCWQASRQALVVELPKVHDEPYADDYTRAFIDGKKSILEEVHDALDKAGASYK